MLDGTNSWSCNASPSSLRVEAHTRRDEIVLAFSGEADVATAPLLAHALTHASESGYSRVALDLAALEFMDTHCLEIIFDTHEKLRDRGADLVLRSPQTSVRRALDILQRQDLIECPDGGPASAQGLRSTREESGTLRSRRNSPGS